MSRIDAVKVRNLKFDVVGSDVPRYWHGDRRAVTLFFNNLSIFFPVGERFFIKTVKDHKHFVKDEKLAQEVKTFYAQEGIHSREHEDYNEMLRRQGYPVAKMEGRIATLLKVVSTLIWLRAQLAVTCALEHFTALMAHWLLLDERNLEGAHPKMAALWRWHAAEENEHKSVAFDVFRAAGGLYVERVLVMFFATLIFWGLVLVQQVQLMWHDGILFSAREWSQLLVFWFRRGGLIQSLTPMYFSYYRPGFEPWELDNAEMLTAFQRELDNSSMYQEYAR
ncbi:MAG: metal-dependent hydrolase [Myxococcales bacterium]